MTKSTWHVDTAHSTVGFSVKHMMISNVKGTFNEFQGTVEADPEDLTGASIDFTIDANSIDTRKADRDNHLRSADFFDVEKYPHLSFKATKIEKTSKDTYDLTGDFTIRDTTKPVTFNVTYEGMAKDPMSGDQAAGFTGNTKINRRDFGLTWNAALETGGVVVSDEVKINIEIQLRK
ncbi:YceI family protein [Sporosarcina ureae]|uniref:YceI family protein n=1 Tax=Sporosarcina ureae TaxID=1571 RepID=UPI0028B1B474|nr:YceI family protein [Sporosarcina ureae]